VNLPLSIRGQLEMTGATHTPVVTPDAQALADIGRNVLDSAKRADAARSGLRQAAEVVEKVRRAWV
jgi:NTE family protein